MGFMSEPESSIVNALQIFELRASANAGSVTPEELQTFASRYASAMSNLSAAAGEQSTVDPELSEIFAQMLTPVIAESIKLGYIAGRNAQRVDVGRAPDISSD